MTNTNDRDEPTDTSERREFPRVKAPLYSRPARKIDQLRRPLVDLGIGGMRVFSDEPSQIGERLEIDI